MAQIANPAVAAAMRAIDERRWLRHGLFWLVRTVLMTWLFLYGLHSTTDWHVALRDSLILLLPAPYSTACCPALAPAFSQEAR
ncbi:hypothetical protein [Hymenobacter ruricola]|uniref:Uncharacterized protein n=1 Tax=Hymenobacter ruricola TaxID=2791023 RepID=A0ABS0I1I2_9BACT|nr:hypothetical protein [Hymenobacter ruricola]MBF9220801.1 hypothetical protein [Hymenobacter ruricola]